MFKAHLPRIALLLQIRVNDFLAAPTGVLDLKRPFKFAFPFFIPDFSVTLTTVKERIFLFIERKEKFFIY